MDGRILNEIAILKEGTSNLHIDFILLPDKPVKVDLGEGVNLHVLNPKVRHNKLLRFLTVLEFTWRAVYTMLKLKPDVVHVHDTAVVLPALLYSFLSRKSYMIYDDHEVPNENANWQARFMHRLEVWLMRRSDYVIHANSERMELIHKRHNINTASCFLLNLPYFEEAKAVAEGEPKRILEEIDFLRSKGVKFIMHQGAIIKDRGDAKLAELSAKLPENFRIMLLGGNRKAFNEFIQKHNADANKFYFVGSVNYSILSLFWERAMASIIMYMPTYTNNKLCAPNRFFIALEHGLPVIVNKSNPVLSNFINTYKSGFEIESFQSTSDFERLVDFQVQDNIDLLNRLRAEERAKLMNLYDGI